MKYSNCILRKGNRVIQVLIYIAPGDDTHRCPCGHRRGKYACDVNGERKYIATHNISRYVTSWGWTLEPIVECYLHAQYSSKTQENVTGKTEGLWRKFLNLFR